MTRQYFLGFRAVLAATSVLLGAQAYGQDTTYTGASGSAGATDTWNIADRWDAGVPTGAINAVIPNSKFVVVNATTPTYDGNLSIGVGSTLQIGWSGAVASAYNALGNATSTTITMAEGSLITTRNGGAPVFPAISLTGNATINFGTSTNVPAQADFNSAITGAYTLTLTSNGQGTQPLVELKAANSFSALVIRDVGGRGNPADTFRANVAGSLGNGDVTVVGTSAAARSPQLRISASDAMADSGTLFLNGLGTTGTGANRLVMDNGVTDTIGGLYLSGVKQISGNYTQAGAGSAFMGTGTGTLVVSGPTTVYWNPTGGPGGTWDGAAIWNDQANLGGTDSAWVAGQTARFNTAGTYGVTVSGTQDVGALGYDLGNVSLTGGGLRLIDNVPVFVASGATATLDSTLSEDVAGRQFHKSGTGTLTLSGSGNSFTGGTFVGDGTLNANSTNALGTGPVTVVGGTLNVNAAQTASSLTVNGGILRLADANAVASASAVGVTVGGRTIQLRGNTATTFAGAPVNFTTTANAQSLTIDVDNNGSGSGNQLVLGGGFNRRVNVNQNTAANGMTLNVTGANGYSLNIPTVNLTGGMSTTFNPTTANLTIGALSATTGVTAFGNANNIVLTLGGGSGTSNSIDSITETSNASQQLTINKNTAATWTLGSVDVKQGNSSAITAGDLILNGTFTFGLGTATARTFNITGGTLHWNNAGAFRTLGSGARVTMNGGNLDQTSGAAITASTHNPQMAWNADFTFIGSNGKDSDLNLGTGSVTMNAARQVTITNAASTLTVGGIISGSGFGLTKTGNGTLELTGNNTYSGATTINAGILAVNGNGAINGTSGITIDGGKLDYTSSVALTQPVTFTNGTLGGTNWTGALSGLTIGAGQVISPGNSPGTTNTGSQTWAPDGTYEFEVNRANGTDGGDPGWDLLLGTGTLNITATSVNPFVIDLVSLDISNGSGPAENFDETENYFWRMAEFASITNFDVSKFFVNDAAFQNPTDGTFSVQLGGTNLGPVTVPGASNQLYLTYIAVPEPGTLALLGVGTIAGLAVLRRRLRLV
jgi:autotransporter-associated beta strand protein